MTDNKKNERCPSGSAHYILGDNIDVDPTFKCHAERSRSIYFKRGLRSFTFVQDDKFAKKNELRVNCYIVTIYYQVYWRGYSSTLASFTVK